MKHSHEYKDWFLPQRVFPSKDREDKTMRDVSQIFIHGSTQLFTGTYWYSDTWQFPSRDTKQTTRAPNPQSGIWIIEQNIRITSHLDNRAEYPRRTSWSPVTPAHPEETPRTWGYPYRSTQKKNLQSTQKICIYIFLFESLRGKFHMYMYCKKCRCRCVLRDLKEPRGRSVSDSFKIGNAW
jgi:hypothetical protein